MRASFRVESETRTSTTDFMSSDSSGGFPRLQLNYSTSFVKSKHFFEKFIICFRSYVQNVKSFCHKNKCYKNLLTTSCLYDIINFGGCNFCAHFYLLVGYGLYFIPAYTIIYLNLLTLFLKCSIIYLENYRSFGEKGFI